MYGKRENWVATYERTRSHARWAPVLHIPPGRSGEDKAEAINGYGDQKGLWLNENTILILYPSYGVWYHTRVQGKAPEGYWPVLHATITGQRP